VYYKALITEARSLTETGAKVIQVDAGRRTDRTTKQPIGETRALYEERANLSAQT